MNDRILIRTGAAGAVFAAICCATPLLSVLLPLVGLGAWLPGTDLMLLPLLAASVGVMAWGLHRAELPTVAKPRFAKKAQTHERLLRILLVA